MLESAWLFVGVVALFATAVTIYTDDDGVAILFGVLGFICWGVWTFGTLEVVVASGTDSQAFTMPAVTILGIALALVPGYIALTGPIDVVSRARRGNVDEV